MSWQLPVSTMVVYSFCFTEFESLSTSHRECNQQFQNVSTLWQLISVIQFWTRQTRYTVGLQIVITGIFKCSISNVVLVFVICLASSAVSQIWLSYRPSTLSEMIRDPHIYFVFSQRLSTTVSKTKNAKIVVCFYSIFLLTVSNRLLR